MNKEQGREIIEVKNQIVQHFDKSDWLDLGYTIGSYDTIEKHDRLLRSLSWGDSDYEGNVLEVLTSIIKKDPKSLQEIKHYLSNKYSIPMVSDFVSTAHTETPKKIITFSPQVFNVPAKPQNDKLVSVMLPFAVNDTFNTINKACVNLGLECKKANDIWENSTFIQDIFELIFISKAVIADFTGKNPNVFYEVGVAHTLGKTVIPVTQSLDDVPADLRHHRVLKYLPNQEGYVALEEQVQKRLETLFPKKELDY